MKGLKRFLLAARIALIFTIATLTLGDQASAKDNPPGVGVDGFIPPQSRVADSGKGLFGAANEDSNPKKNEGSGDSPQSGKKPNYGAEGVEKPLNSYAYIGSKTDDESDSETGQCLVDEPARGLSGMTDSGEMFFVRSQRIRDKGTHIPDFVTEERLKQAGVNVEEFKAVEKLDRADRLAYYNNRENLPDEIVTEVQTKIIDAMSSSSTKKIPNCYIGKSDREVDVFYNQENQKVYFRDKYTYDVLDAMKMRPKKLAKVIVERRGHFFNGKNYN